MCDPYLLFRKIEDELYCMVLGSRIRQLNLLKDENNPALAEEFITGQYLNNVSTKSICVKLQLDIFKVKRTVN